MIQETITYQCRACHSSHIVKNGHNAQGQQQYWCKNCGKRAVLVPKVRYTEAQKEQILAAYYERPSMRGVERSFGVSRHTLADWLKKSDDKPKPTSNPSTRPGGGCARTG